MSPAPTDAVRHCIIPDEHRAVEYKIKTLDDDRCVRAIGQFVARVTGQRDLGFVNRVIRVDDQMIAQIQ